MVLDGNAESENPLALGSLGQPPLMHDTPHKSLPESEQQEAVREGAQRFQLALSAGHLGDWSWDARTDVVTLGAKACEIFGLPVGTLTTLSKLRELAHPDDVERVRRAVDEALAKRADYDLEYRIRRGDSKKLVWIAAQGRPVYTAEGALRGLIGVVQDVTERKEGEEIRARLAAVVESSDDAIISMSLDAIITTWNRGAERTFGYAAAEAVGRSVTILIPENAEDEEPRILRKLLGGERVEHYETVRKRKDGTLVDVSLSVSPIYDSEGKIAGVSKISRDITERKRAEEALRKAEAELRRHAETLEEQVAERTARLRETIQELESFSYSVSHDMRSPLRAMQGYSDALLEDFRGQLDPVAQDYLKRISRAAARMDALIQDVLAYSRVAKGEIELTKVNLETVISDVIQTYPAIEKAKADIRVHEPLPKVLAHEAYLTQIISNLLGNALKFVAPGAAPRVDIRATSKNGMVRISVRDTGIGIAPEHQKQIFQIFGRVYSDKKYEGTGIGLAIVKKAAERMGGSIEVKSELGHGSEFSVFLKEAK